MRGKLWIVFAAGVAIFLINDLHVFGTAGFGIFFDFGLSIWCAYKAWSQIRNTAKVSDQPKAGAVSSHVNIRPGPSGTSVLNPAWVIALCFLFVMSCFAYNIMAAAGLNFFVWADHVFGAGSNLWPIFTWTVAGTMLGTLAGSLIFWRKYHISFKRCLVLIGPFILLLYLFQFMSGPLQAVIPRPLTLTADTQKVQYTKPAEIVPKRKRHRIQKPNTKIDSIGKAAKPVQDCGRASGEITINSHTDSVNVYYRLSAYDGAPWGAWQSKFVALQGQFSLTEGGPVSANGLQYYYESHAVLTRSAQNPYTKKLCEGPLVIDAY